MGTVWRAAVAGADAAALPDRIAPVLARIVAQMSHWVPDSTLSRCNRLPIGQWLAIESDFATVLSAAIAVARDSGGAFDPAAGTLVDLWGFGPPGPRDAPDAQDIDAALRRSGCDGIEWDPAMRRVRRVRDVALDLSGIAKGHAVDAVSAALHAAGHADHLVEIGGEFVASGIRPDGQPWWIDVEAVPGIASEPLRIAACDVAVATSGDYRRHVADDPRLSHSIDPRTGRPIAHSTAQVTIIADDCMTADAWATALTVLAPDAARAKAVERRIAARIVWRGDAEGREWLSPALRAMLG